MAIWLERVTLNKGSLKSQVDLTFTSLLGVIDDLKSYTRGTTERPRDRQTVVSRYRHEGKGFLSSALPALGKAIDLALQERVRLACPGFSDRPGTVLPDFLHDLFVQVFDRDSGFVKPPCDVKPRALVELRQVCFYAYKEEYAFTREHRDAAVQKMRTVDDLLPAPDAVAPERRTQRVIDFAGRLIGSLFAGINPLDVRPGHGPGAVATGEKPYEKMTFARKYLQIAEVYPYQRYFWLGWHHLNNDGGHYDSLVVEGSGVSKMALVPKDSRGPRTISLEPLEYQWIQQGLKTLMYDWIEGHPLTKGHVNFTNQEINRKLALEGSENQKWITLDLQDASDRVSVWLVKNLFKRTALLKPLLATRSTHMRLLDNSILELKKFAPMGSAVCFPVEAVCFWALVVSCLVVTMKRPLGLTLKSVYVFGDDIITLAGPGIFPELCRLFEDVGLKVNADKSCTSGSFRESCGMDAYNGTEVTPIRVKKKPPTDRRSADQVVSWVERMNLLYSKGYVRAASVINRYMEKLLGDLPQIPLADPPVGFLHKRTTDSDVYIFSKKTRLHWVPCQQTWMAEVWTWTGVSVNASPRYNWSQLLHRLLNVGEEVQTDRFTMPKKLKLKKTWVHLHGAPVAVKWEPKHKAPAEQEAVN